MDPYSFLNTAHTAFFAELYNEYLLDPGSVQPSWRAFFQGFEFGIDKKSKNEANRAIIEEWRDFTIRSSRASL